MDFLIMILKKSSNGIFAKNVRKREDINSWVVAITPYRWASLQAPREADKRKILRKSATTF